MAVFQRPLAPTMEQPYANQQLFSDHYLAAVLPKHPAWAALQAQAAPLLEHIAAILAQHTPSSIEAQTEDNLIKPVLTALGHTFEVQVTLKSGPNTFKPDYILYRDANAVIAHKGLTVTERELQATALAVADAKYWERPLDVTLRQAASSAKENPAKQIDDYIRHSGLAWGILTNGRYWRLYHRDTSRYLNVYYEIDLPTLAAQNNADTFTYFTAFFQRAAFDETAPLNLTAILKASTDYARTVSDNLQQQVYAALRHLAQGFLDYPANRFQPDPATLAQIYDHSLIVLYRLLFILYAESRDLLPLRTSATYRNEYSLDAIKRTIAHKLDDGVQMLPTSAGTWARLKDLFTIINRGSPPLRVATFNGGLFDPDHYPFLEQYGIGDAQLFRAIDQLTRVEGQFIDYRDLAERHLGSIYEGLLEYQLQPLEAPERDPATGLVWLLKLSTDRGERKRTGSYYTPDYIVEYMLDQAVGPILQAAVADQPDDAAKVQAVLAVNVVDPSMGSGHFLVALTEYIARFLVSLSEVREAERQGESDLVYWKRRVAQSCIYGVDLNPLAVDLAKLSLWLATVAQDKPLSFLDHHLRCGNALVGAWLGQLRPLLVTSTSRLAARRNQTQAAEQVSMFADSDFREQARQAVTVMQEIEALAGDTLDEVREQERLYAALQANLRAHYEQAANLTVATGFGLPLDPALWRVLLDCAVGREDSPLPQFDELIAQATAIAAAQRFFHWELAFPEVFFAADGQPLREQAGFDAVVGNPPYVRQEALAPVKPYLSAAYPEVYHGTADLYVYFYQQGVRLLRQGGRMGYITSGTFARSNFAKPFRAYLPTTAQIESLIDFGENQPFKGAEMVRPTIVILSKTPQVQPFRSLFVAAKIPDNLAIALKDDGIVCEPSVLAGDEWVFQDTGYAHLSRKIFALGVPLIEIVNGQMFRGVLTGLNEAFLIDAPTRNRLIAESPNAADIIKPLVRGEDLRPWYQEDEGRYLIFTRRGIDIEQYPAVKRYLEQFRDQLEPKPYDWSGNNWKGRKSGAYAWYEIQDSVEYYEAFNKTKIFWPAIGNRPRFSWGEAQYYTNNSAQIIPTSDMSLLGFLQSRVIWFTISQICTPLRLRSGLWQYQQFIQFIARLPIPDAPAAEREAIGNLATTITELARTRYRLHQKAWHRIHSDLGGGAGPLTQKLTRWWELDFAAFRREVGKAFKHDIPLREREEWEAWLDEQRSAHHAHTAEIVRLERDLNARVYALFELSPAEIALIEASTLYQYGEV